MAHKLNISIIGPGRVGLALGRLLARRGYRVTVAGRSIAKGRAAAAKIGPMVRPATAAAAAGGDIVLLTVNDDAIAPLCKQLAKRRAFRPGCVVAHCSGALGSDILAPAKRACQCRIASMHPLQTFPNEQAALAAVKGTYFFLEGDADAVAALTPLVRAVGGWPQTIEPAAKALYHAAACMACNYLTALMDAALEAQAQAGIDRRLAWVAMAPMIEATLNNITTAGPAGALTGPIARGDAATVRRHLTALARHRDLADLYRSLGRWTVGLAVRKGLAPSAKNRLLKTLRSRPGEPS